MLIKSRDDKSKRLSLLADLQKSPLLNRNQHDWLRDEVHKLKRGIQGEKDAAHYLDNYLEDDPNRALMHDLRFEVDGAAVQIDHLVLTRSLHCYLLETKNFNGELHINDFGEFSVEYSGERIFGIPSPIEQSRRHEAPLRKLFLELGVQGRNGGQVHFHHCVLVNPSSIIHRPRGGTWDTSNVIKADQFRSWHERIKEAGPTTSLVVDSLLNIRSSDTLRAMAQKLARRHRPADLLSLPDFLKPPPNSDANAGLSLQHQTSAVLVESATRDLPPVPAQRKLICATCGSKISFAEGKYCWNKESRFRGLQYCREHQAAF